MKRLFQLLGVLIVLAIVYLLVWPIDVDPEAWTPPAAPTHAPNGRLAGAERLLVGQGIGPEAIAFDAKGNLYTGYLDGRIVRMRADGAVETFANTGGRPLGMAFDAAGRLYVADGRAGLLLVDPDGKVTTVAAEHGGRRILFADDVVVAPSGLVYVSDASTRRGPEGYRMEALEHRPNGRVLAWDPEARRLDVLIDRMYFPNGLAVSADGSQLLVAETIKYRVMRHWLRGEKKGTTEVLVENLPGFPDNVTRAPDGRYWVAIFSPRLAIFDRLLPHPFLRKMVGRLPELVQPQPVHHAMVIHLDETGAIAEILDDTTPGAYAPVTSCREHDGKLWLGSLSADAIAVVATP